jgi:predicted SnoaL-like aldol condensation-catalyzing enzyme
MANTDLVARLIDCWNTGKFEDIDNILSPNFIRHEAAIEGGTTSRDEYQQIVTRYRGALVHFHTEAVDIIEDGNKVALRFKTTGKRDGAPVTFEGVNILRIEGGKIVEDWVYFDATGLQRKLAKAQSA